MIKFLKIILKSQNLILECNQLHYIYNVIEIITLLIISKVTFPCVRACVRACVCVCVCVFF